MNFQGITNTEFMRQFAHFKLFAFNEAAAVRLFRYENYRCNVKVYAYIISCESVIIFFALFQPICDTVYSNNVPGHILGPILL